MATKSAPETVQIASATSGARQRPAGTVVSTENALGGAFPQEELAPAELVLGLRFTVFFFAFFRFGGAMAFSSF